MDHFPFITKNLVLLRLSLQPSSIAPVLSNWWPVVPEEVLCGCALLFIYLHLHLWSWTTSICLGVSHPAGSLSLQIRTTYYIGWVPNKYQPWFEFMLIRASAIYSSTLVGVCLSPNRPHSIFIFWVCNPSHDYTSEKHWFPAIKVVWCFPCFYAPKSSAFFRTGTQVMFLAFDSKLPEKKES